MKGKEPTAHIYGVQTPMNLPDGLAWRRHFSGRETLWSVANRLGRRRWLVLLSLLSILPTFQCVKSWVWSTDPWIDQQKAWIEQQKLWIDWQSCESIESRRSVDVLVFWSSHVDWIDKGFYKIWCRSNQCQLFRIDQIATGLLIIFPSNQCRSISISIFRSIFVNRIRTLLKKRVWSFSRLRTYWFDQKKFEKLTVDAAEKIHQSRSLGAVLQNVSVFSPSTRKQRFPPASRCRRKTRLRFRTLRHENCAGSE